ncbi:MAG: Holliday junction branch migration protein RuvA, partial [Aeriscardovia aeriphila]|nr:Holliday junction branch migration protein RuvA [Aeriscardovia aeriphila]
MIAQLTGLVASIGPDSAVIDCNGIGFGVHMPHTDLARLREGREETVFTHMALTQDALTLYGFISTNEREVFLRLQKVSGVGPKAALALLSTCGVEGISTAVASQDVTALSKAPGVGKRMAQKIIVELTGKLDGVADVSASAPATLPDGMTTILQGLDGLGIRPDTAKDALNAVMQQHGFEVDVP